MLAIELCMHHHLMPRCEGWGIEPVTYEIRVRHAYIRYKAGFGDLLQGSPPSQPWPRFRLMVMSLCTSNCLLRDGKVGKLGHETSTRYMLVGAAKSSHHSRAVPFGAHGCGKASLK